MSFGRDEAARIRGELSALDGCRPFDADGPVRSDEVDLVVMKWPPETDSVHVDPLVPVLAVVDDEEGAARAVGAGAADAVLGSSDGREFRIRALLLAGSRSRKSLGPGMTERILLGELGRADRDECEISLILAKPDHPMAAGDLADLLARSVRSSDYSATLSDGSVLVVLPATPRDTANHVARRLASVLPGEISNTQGLRVTGGRIGHMTPSEVLELVSGRQATV